MLLQEKSSEQHQERQETSVTPCYYRKKAPNNIRRQETSVTPCYYMKKAPSNIRRDPTFSGHPLIVISRGPTDYSTTSSSSVLLTTVPPHRHQSWAY
ncbi:hypothetical protein ACOMHN_004595 [Nucella lapillus]